RRPGVVPRLRARRRPRRPAPAVRQLLRGRRRRRPDRRPHARRDPARPPAGPAREGRLVTDQMIRTRPAVEPRTRRGPRAWAKPVVLAALPLLAAALPYLDVQVPLLFDGPLGSPGVLHVLSL